MDNSESVSQLISFGGLGDQSLTAIAVFILGVAFTIIWRMYLSDKYRVTVKIDFKEAVLNAPDDMKEKISLKYSDEDIDRLHYFYVTVKNTGNRGIKNQQVRLGFPDGSKLIDERDIEHEPLIGPVELLEEDSEPVFLTYCIGNFPIKSSIKFKFVAKDCCHSELAVHTKNDSCIDTELISDGRR